MSGDRILRAFPAAFFRQMQEYADAAFAEALTLTRRHAEEPEQANMLGQHRHTRCEAGFRQAAAENKLTFFAPHTEPAGGRYSLVSADGVYLVRSNVQRHCGTPRWTSFRQHWAALNQWLDPVQPDLLRTVPPPRADRLCGMLVITSHPRRGDPSILAFVGLGVPRADLSDWKALLSLGELLARYHDMDGDARKPETAPVFVKDRAIPSLKRRPSEKE
jgi:hypothetical protein